MREHSPLIAVLVAVPILLAMNFSGSASSDVSHNISIRLTLPGIENSVYIPGTGPVPAYSSHGPETPGNYFIASYLGDVVYALVSGSGAVPAVSLAATSSNHTLEIAIPAGSPGAFLVFTEGDWQTIQNRMPLVESLEFLGKISPSFSYGLGYTYPIKIVIESPSLFVPKTRVFSGPSILVMEFNSTAHKVSVGN